jgi:hypothetical protein
VVLFPVRINALCVLLRHLNRLVQVYALEIAPAYRLWKSDHLHPLVHENPPWFVQGAQNAINLNISNYFFTKIAK